MSISSGGPADRRAQARCTVGDSDVATGTNAWATATALPTGAVATLTTNAVATPATGTTQS